ncbi:hypothetical protein GEMRC1_007995 [Eukaryota sp. GEM-RC1]
MDSSKSSINPQLIVNSRLSVHQEPIESSKSTINPQSIVNSKSSVNQEPIESSKSSINQESVNNSKSSIKSDQNEGSAMTVEIFRLSMLRKNYFNLQSRFFVSWRLLLQSSTSIESNKPSLFSDFNSSTSISETKVTQLPLEKKKNQSKATKMRFILLHAKPTLQLFQII